MTKRNPGVTRCAWAGDDPLMVAYHDEEWGVPSRDERHLFEMLTLEGAQAGLSWSTILRKREGYRRAFKDFDAVAVARFTKGDLDRLVSDAGIVRHRGKIESTIANARAILAVRRDAGSLSRFLWQLVGDVTRVNAWQTLPQIPSESPESTALSRALKKRGFSFVGPTTCYAFMHAVGMVDDHVESCFRRASRQR